MQETKKDSKRITSREQDYAQWYLDVIAAADLAEYAPVKGCMIIKPYGYSIWENIQKILDEKLKAIGAKNVYFPIFIPQSLLVKEAKHVAGFVPECLVVTQAGGKELSEPLIVRPTSETIIYEAFSRWIKSYRDLPLVINQWANIVRRELRPRLFLRTTEFLWQEGHTAHATKKEAEIKTQEMTEVYKSFIEDCLAIPVMVGIKTEAEKFAGAEKTYTLEGMMQDKRALQLGTSHLLGQNFAKAFNVKFLDKNNKKQYVWQTSWGVSTRLIGSLIMSHSDDKGLVLPPKIAPLQVVIIPVWTKPKEKNLVLKKAESIRRHIAKLGKTSVEIDRRELVRPGAKFFEWEKRGVPLRLEIGPKDIAKKSVVVVRRDTSEKKSISEKELIKYVREANRLMQKSLFSKALSFQKNNSYLIDSWEEFKKIMVRKPGFVQAHWCSRSDCETKIKEETGATIRLVPFDQKREKGKCFLCGQTSNGRVIFAKAY